jgi:hypothetical protein
MDLCANEIIKASSPVDHKWLCHSPIILIHIHLTYSICAIY